ncbi:MAG: hypothetical protein QGG15_02650 [Dehalococcoidales bacterium]|jgi:hypothetical protein|nr:hypothetical protein [Dehalococcoidales bacterium]MDP6737912.1 hypothetical protein [Dehalococcoidales bacterium]|tara:strand:+ start:625 stop:864 length:240 start_codon:yes stop_codon:yes gene_type:complete
MKNYQSLIGLTLIAGGIVFLVFAPYWMILMSVGVVVPVLGPAIYDYRKKSKKENSFGCRKTPEEILKIYQRNCGIPSDI